MIIYKKILTVVILLVILKFRYMIIIFQNFENSIIDFKIRFSFTKSPKQIIFAKLLQKFLNCLVPSRLSKIGICYIVNSL